MKKILITGGTKGIGLSIAMRLLNSYDIYVIGRNDPGIDSLTFIYADLLESIPDIDYSQFYGLVNNAAIGIGGLIPALSSNNIDKMIRLNLTVPILLSQKFVKGRMIALSPGKIVNISSVVTQKAEKGLSVYTATKGGLSAFTRSLAKEVGKLGIQVNEIIPGYIQTDMTSSLSETQIDLIRRKSPLKKLTSVDDITGLVAYLLLEATSITGASFVVDAGLSL